MNSYKINSLKVMGDAAKYSPVYRRWKEMNKRCNNPNSIGYHHYGGRGIRVCHRWKIFRNFEKDMLPTFSPELTLDRIDVNKDYSPDNCRWATVKEQNNNRRDTVFFTISGATKSFSAWIEQSGLKKSTVYQRYYVYKWPIEKALNQEVM